MGEGCAAEHAEGKEGRVAVAFAGHEELTAWAAAGEREGEACGDHAHEVPQPVAFNTLVSGNFLWAFLGMFLVGFASILLGGCPLRQLILAGAGSSDAVMAVLGMTVGAAFCHNFGFAHIKRNA